MSSVRNERSRLTFSLGSLSLGEKSSSKTFATCDLLLLGNAAAVLKLAAPTEGLNLVGWFSESLLKHFCERGEEKEEREKKRKKERERERERER